MGRDRYIDREKPNQVSGGKALPADSDVDFVLHAPGRDYDLVELCELDFEEIEEDEDVDEEEDTGVWEAPRPKNGTRRGPGHAAGETPWWQAARRGLRAQDDG